MSLWIATSVYILGFPFAFWLIGFADKKLKYRSYNNKMMKPGANRAHLSKNPPVLVYPKWKQRLKFARSDKRSFVIGSPKKGSEPKEFGVTRRSVYWILRLVGLVVAVVGGLLGLYIALLFAAVFYYAATVYGYISSDKLMKAREAVYERMFTIARTKLGVSPEHSANPQAVIEVLEWSDGIKPQKVKFDIPDTFGEEGTESFLKQFNLIFGRETAWVPSDNPETGEPGWNFDKGTVTINAVPPLPRIAPWSEHYVINDAIAWSFFPIGLGVENGLELPNPNTGLVENVIGFDFSGLQAKAAQEAGLKMSQTIGVSPMILIGGSTGGGKSLASETLVKVFEREDLSK